MYIFYDFETSSRELLGQIMTYAFMVVDQDLNVVTEFTGAIKLNRTQLPEVEALLTNRINILEHQKTQDTEYDAARKIHDFLAEQIATHGYCTLVGYNSNRFDLEFLRTTLIRYGINPYFRGMLANLDIYHYIQHLAFSFEESFPWTLKEEENGAYYSFKLEDMAKAFNILDTAQSHDAIEDVKLTINLVKTCQKQFGLSLNKFKPVQLPVNTSFQADLETGKEKVRHYSEDDVPHHFAYTYWLKILSSKNASLVLDLEAYNTLKQDNNSLSTEQILSCLRYKNHNKQFFILDPLSEHDRSYFDATIQLASQEPFLQQLSLDKYFDLTAKDWDIDYQIHQLGFERIDELNSYVNRLIKKPETYSQLLQELLAKRKNQKDNYLIQLFNRVYLNYHPNPAKEHLNRYMEPRYINKTLYRNPEDARTLSETINTITTLKNQPKNPDDLIILEALDTFFKNTTHLIAPTSTLHA